MSDVEQAPHDEGDEGAEVPHSSDAEIIEAEAALETPAAPTGEATWAEDEFSGEPTT